MKNHLPTQDRMANYGRLLGVMITTAAIAVIVYYVLFGITWDSHF